MIISMYIDTASHYGLCEDDGVQDNEVLLNVPDDLLDNYYEAYVKPEDEDYKDVTVEEWVRLHYNYDEMEGLLDDIQTQTGSLDCVEVIE